MRKIIPIMATLRHCGYAIVIAIISHVAHAAGRVTYLSCTASSNGKTYTEEYVLNEPNGTVSRKTFTTKATFGRNEVSWSTSSGGRGYMDLSFVTRYKINRADLSYEESMVAIGISPSTGQPTQTESITRGTCKILPSPKKNKF